MDHPLDFYEYLLLDPFTKVCDVIDKSKLNDYHKAKTLLIDRFAIHSSSYFHLSKGIIKQNSSTEEHAVFGFDLFSINALFRVLMETYATFNHIYIESNSESEIEFCFFIWKLDGLYDKHKFEINDTDFKEAKFDIAKNKDIINETITRIQSNVFYKSIDNVEINKILDFDSKKAKWRFLVKNNCIKPMNITALVNHTCCTRGMRNSYRYTSNHTHSNSLSIEHFESFRGKEIPDDYRNPQLDQAIFLTMLLISDICSIFPESKAIFESFHDKLKITINGFVHSIRNPK